MSKTYVCGITFHTPVASLLMAKPSTGGTARLSLGSSNTNDEHLAPYRSLKDLSSEVQELFEQQLSIDTLLSISRKLQSQLKESLTSSPQCMLPSHQYRLPSGKEEGSYLALEVGGTNLQVALVEFRGQEVTHGRLRVRRIESSPIEASRKESNGVAFFDWMAQKIKDVLGGDQDTHDHIQSMKPLRMGIAWSFPLESV